MRAPLCIKLFPSCVHNFVAAHGTNGPHVHSSLSSSIPSVPGILDLSRSHRVAATGFNQLPDILTSVSPACLFYSASALSLLHQESGDRFFGVEDPRVYWRRSQERFAVQC